MDHIELRRFDRDEVDRPARGDPRRRARRRASPTRSSTAPAATPTWSRNSPGGARRRRPRGPAAVAAGRAAQPGGRAEPGRAAAAAHRVGGRADGALTGCWPRWPGSARPSSSPPCGRRWRTICCWSTPGGHGYAFRHALTRDAVYEDMLPGERVRLHAAYGEALAGDPALAGDEAALPAALAHHWYAALDLPRALPAAIDAARHAMASYAPAEALRHLERALEIWPRVADADERTGLDQIEVSRLAAEAAYRSGALDRSRPCCHDALAELPAGRRPGAPGAAARAVRAGAAGRGQAARGGRVAGAGAGAAARGPDHPGARRRARRAGRRADARHRDARRRRRGPAGGRAAAQAGAPDVEADAAITLGSASSYLGPPRPAWAAALGRAAGARPRHSRSPRCAATSTCPTCWNCSAGTPRPPRPPPKGSALAARVGHGPHAGSYLVGNQAEPLLRLGRWAEADQLTAEALSALPEGVFARHPAAAARRTRRHARPLRRGRARAARRPAGPWATPPTSSSPSRCGTPTP